MFRKQAKRNISLDNTRCKPQTHMANIPNLCITDGKCLNKSRVQNGKPTSIADGRIKHHYN